MLINDQVDFFFFFYCSFVPVYEVHVTIKELLARSLQVEADSVSDAESAVKRLYRNNDVVLSADDYAGTEIVVELPPISSADAILDLR